MSVAGWAFALYVAMGSLAVLASSLAALVVRRRTRALIELPENAPERWPSLSVIVPACNEGSTIEAALRSLIRADYPDLEVVVVNDRSTDETGAIIDRLAQASERVVPVHVTDLPEGWLGKVHALARGLERSHGQYVLFTDADVHFSPGALRRAVALAVKEGHDHLALLPEMPLHGFWRGVTIAAAFRSILLLARLWEANDPRSPRAMGVGAFNLVRREALDASPGLSWLRLEVADDVGLGIMMKRHSGRSQLLLGRGLVRVDWYPTLRAAVRGLEKNGFAQAARFRAGRGFGLAALAAGLAVAPFVGLLPLGPAGLAALPALALGLHLAVSALNARAFAVPWWCLFLALPLGDLVMAFIIARATWLGLRRGGVVWRGTSYPSRLLAEGRRVDM